jgi:mycothiol synthase
LVVKRPTYPPSVTDGSTDDYWVEPADDDTDRAARDAGYRPARDLLHMRRALPLGETAAVTTRPFRRGHDEAAWLEVNNRAFAWHPDQSNQTLGDLERKMAEPWFDPEGFLLHEIDGRLAGFCWTKVHADTDPPAGEIFVIGVDPDFTGRGLGRSLTVAGLQHLFAHDHTPVAMLYVEADNASAVALYEGLGFEVAHRRRQYVRD